VPTITLEVPTAGTEIEAGLHATNYADLQTLLNGGLDNSNIDATAVLDATARVGIRKNGAGSTFSRRRINFIEGSGVTLTVADDSGNEEVDVTIAASTASTIYRKTTEKDVVSTTSETDLLNGEITIGAGVMSTDKMLRATLICDYLNNTGSTQNLTLAVKLGATTLWADTLTGASAIVNAATRRPLRIVLEIGNLGAANSQFLSGFLWLGANQAATSGLGDFSEAVGPDGDQWGGSFAGSSSEDTASAKTLVVTATHGSANASLSCRLKYACIEVV
jgi:hypothetical protein